MMANFKVALLGYRDEWELERLRAGAPEGVDVVGTPIGSNRDVNEAVAVDADVILPWLGSFDLDMGRKATHLKMVQALSAGTDYLPVAELAEMGILVANNGGANSVAVAEHAVMLMVSAYRQAHTQMNQIYDGKYIGDFWEIWEQIHEISGKRVGIIGLGTIGSRVAKRLQGWECEVVYHDIKDFDDEYVSAANATRVPLDELLSTADVVTVHVPLDRSTRGMLSDREFGLMKPTAIVVNTCRGPVIDETALISALDDEQIAGAGIDVTEIEPIPEENGLKHRRNVTLTPHLAGLSIEAREKALDWAIANASRLAAGQDPGAVILPV
jgi:phosphoglycerate dehydrogenase-like enzyme